MTENLEKLRSLIVAAVPAIEKEQKVCEEFLCALDSLPCDPSEAFGEIPEVSRPIRLSDVFLAITDKFAIGIGDGRFDLAMDSIYLKSKGIHFKWDLRNDDINLQSEATVEFLLSILTPKV